jgi:hypothetical protein
VIASSRSKATKIVRAQFDFVECVSRIGAARLSSLKAQEFFPKSAAEKPAAELSGWLDNASAYQLVVKATGNGVFKCFPAPIAADSFCPLSKPNDGSASN